MRRFNLLTGECEADMSHGDFGGQSTRVGERIGAQRLGASLYELAAGQRAMPYHYHHGVEEWLYVVTGAPVLRAADGEYTLRAGDVVTFPAGVGGAHSVCGPGRVLILSDNREPSIAGYPDSNKLGARPPHRDQSARADRLNFRRADAVGYWEGE